MHELSIAMSIIDMATVEAERRGWVKIDKVHLKLGPLSGVVKESLLFSFEVACEGSPLEGSRLVVEEVPVVIFCPVCQAERELNSIQLFCCPICGALSSQVVSGNELEVVALEILE